MPNNETLPRCNFCKYTIPEERKVFNNPGITHAYCQSPVVTENKEKESRMLMPTQERERTCDNCTPAEVYQLPKVDNWKFKVKFVPVPFEEDILWSRYRQQMAEESEEEVDEAVKAFQSFTDKKKLPSKKKKMKVKYIPQYVNEDLSGMTMSYPSKKHKRGITFDISDQWMPRAQSFPGQFQDSMKFTAVHKNYRQPEQRQAYNYQTSDSATAWAGAIREKKRINMLNDTKEGQAVVKKRKVKYRAMPAYPEARYYR